MGSKGKDAKANKKQKLKAKIRKLEKQKKQLQKKIKKLKAGQQTAAPVQGVYPSPMKPGRYKSSYAPYRVIEVENLTPTVMRVLAEPAGPQRLTSQGLMGEYLYLVTGKKGEVLPAAQLEKGRPRWQQATAKTKYTVRSYREETGALEINLVLHPGGAGASWARQVKPGDLAHFMGPKSGYQISDDYDFYLLAGDETGLPGMARWLESMPYDARGAAFIEVAAESSQQVIDAPDGFDLIWVDASQPGALAEAVLSYPLPRGSICTWLAGEAGSLRLLRPWVRRELGVPKGHSYAKGYWKRK